MEVFQVRIENGDEEGVTLNLMMLMVHQMDSAWLSTRWIPRGWVALLGGALSRCDYEGDP